MFAQVTWTPAILDDRLELTFGGRYTEDNRKATRTTLNIFSSGFSTPPVSSRSSPVVAPAGNSIDEDFSKFNPAFTANMAWTTDVSTYLRIATGYKAGGISEAGAVGTFNSAFVFEPEEILTYELGLKSMLADDRVRLNMAVFYSEFDDMQLGFNTNPADLSEVLLTNAGEATVGGVEIEGQWAATDDLQFSFNYTYLDPEIDRVDAPAGTIFDPAANSLSPYEVGDNIAERFALPYTSENSYAVSADWTFAQFGASALSAHLNYRWQDDFFASAPTGPAVPNRELYQIDAHDTLDARLMWSFDISEGRQARVSVWGTNILDDETPQHIIGQGAIIPLAGPQTGEPTSRRATRTRSSPGGRSRCTASTWCSSSNRRQKRRSTAATKTARRCSTAGSASARVVDHLMPQRRAPTGRRLAASAAAMLDALNSICRRRGILRSCVTNLRFSAPGMCSGVRPSSRSACRATSAGGITPGRLAASNPCRPSASVSVAPGASTSTSMPVPASSPCSPIPRLCTKALVAAYALDQGNGASPSCDPVKMMPPVARVRSRGRSACASSSGARALTFSIASSRPRS